jgi:NADH:ubiquinone oxidoreductase subunit 4 (subunit M)
VVAPVNVGVESIELATEEVAPGSDSVEPVASDVQPMEWVAWAPLAALTVLFGVAPGLLLTPVADAARAFFGAL